MRSTDWKWYLLFYLSLAILTGVVSQQRRVHDIDYSADYQKRIWITFGTQGEAGRSEDQVFRCNSTRIFIPALVAGTVKITGLSWAWAFSLVRLVTILLAYLAFHWYLRGWFSSSLAVLGTLFVAATIHLTFNNWWELPTEFPELLIFTLGLWCIRERRHGLLCVFIALGTLNRETTAFLPLILLLCSFDRKSLWSWMPKVATAGFSWLVPLAGIRMWSGIGWRGSYGDSLSHNLEGLSNFMNNLNPYNHYLFYLYLFGIFWILPFTRWNRQPAFLRRALLSVPVFLVVYIFFGGYLDEPREIINLYPLLVPAGLFALFGDEQLSLSASNSQIRQPV